MTGAKLTLGSQEEQDNLLIQQAFAFDPKEFDREFEPGEKADDAIDFGDLSDGDLAEDQDDSIQDEKDRNRMKGDESGDESSQQTIDSSTYLANASSSWVPSVYGINEEVQTGDFETEQPENDADDELDYLFTGGLPSSSSAESETKPKEGQSCASPIAAEPHGEVKPHKVEGHAQGHAQGKSKDPSPKTDESAQQSTESKGTPKAEPSTLVEMQRKLFAMTGSVAPCDSLGSLWPTFKRGTIPKFMKLVPPPNTPYIGAKRPERIKPVKPTRIKLELASDQARSFKLPLTQTTKRQESADNDLITGNTTRIEDAACEPDLGFESTASELDDEPIGAVSWEDLDFASVDLDSFDERPPSPERMETDDYDSCLLPRQDKEVR